MRHPRSYGSKTVTARSARTQLIQLLYSCTPERLAALTVDALVSMYRVDRREAECELIVARQKRAGEAA